MEKGKLVDIKAEIEQRYWSLCKERDTLKQQWDEKVTEIARVQGEFRLAERLVNEYQEPKDVTGPELPVDTKPPEPPEAEVVKPKQLKKK